jgi:hypothetical protein
MHVMSLELEKRDVTVNGLSLEVDKPCASTMVVDVIAYLPSGDSHGITGHIIQLGDRSK